MPKKLNLDLHIKEVLKEGPLHYKEIVDAVNKKLGDSAPSSQKDSYGEALTKLLKQRNIQIHEYSSTKKRDQRIKQENLVFSLIKSNKDDIRYLFIRLESESKSERERSYKELETLFYKKLDEIFKINMENWDSLIKKVYSRPPNDDELLWYVASGEVDQKLQKNPDILEMSSIDDINDEISIIMGEYKEKISELRIKYEGLLLYLLKDSFNGDSSLPNSMWEQYLFSRDKSVEEKLLIENGYEKPENWKNLERAEMFEKVISFTKTREQGKNELIEDLIWGLSENKEFIEKFDDIILQATGKKLIIIFDSPKNPHEFF